MSGYKNLVPFKVLHSHTQVFCNHTATFNNLKLMARKVYKSVSDAPYWLGRAYEIYSVVDYCLLVWITCLDWLLGCHFIDTPQRPFTPPPLQCEIGKHSAQPDNSPVRNKYHPVLQKNLTTRNPLKPE